MFSFRKQFQLDLNKTLEAFLKPVQNQKKTDKPIQWSLLSSSKSLALPLPQLGEGHIFSEN